MASDFDPVELDRRQLLRVAAVMGGAAALAGLLPEDAAAQAPSGGAKLSLVNPKYERLYKQRKNYLMNDPLWVKETAARLVWPKEGEEIPELGVLVPSTYQDWIDA
ncbi:MAG: twin-arginine translocation signal domain-containing protein, partial [Hyphomicrobiaceae bacterium]|nr:twin-arginine translocation signal domain-containing protein [Hyphomicrobiaceae bacterium]